MTGTAARSEQDITLAVAEGREEIISDMLRQVVPFTVSSFSQLHDYVDANEYCGFTTTRAGWSTEDVNRVTGQLDAWLANPENH